MFNNKYVLLKKYLHSFTTVKPLTPYVNPPPYISPLTVNTPVALCT